MSRSIVLILLGLFASIVLVSAPLLGIENIPPGVYWGDAEPGQLDLFCKLRLPRVALAFLAGSALALAGMAFQAMFRNPLATPFTLGVASGASLGAFVAIYLGLSFVFLGLSSISWFAFLGAMGAITLVFGLTQRKQGFSTATMLLAGVAVSFFFSSLILFLQYLSDHTSTFRMIRWMMGSLEAVVGFDDVLDVLPFVASGVLILLYLTHELNLITTSDELAMARGVDVDRIKLVLFLTASLMVGAVVSVCGPIGFVGLMAPHICRLMIGADHRYLTPAVVLFGGAFLTFCDTLARVMLAPVELPVGILTALLGGPFFLWLLLGRTSQVEVA